MTSYEYVFIDTVNPNNSAKRVPTSGEFDRPIDGVYVYNPSTTADVRVALNRDASGNPAEIVVPKGEWRDIGLRVKQFVSVYSTGNVSVNLVGYRICSP